MTTKIVEDPFNILVESGTEMMPQGQFNSKAVGLDSWVQSAQKSILRGDPIFESAAWFFVSILKFISSSIFEIEIHEKKIPCDQKNFIFEGRFLITIIYSTPTAWEFK